MKKVTTMLFLFILSGCSLLFNHPHPKIKNISYYDENFKLDSSFGLRVDGVYYRVSVYDSVIKYNNLHYYKFYSNGNIRSLSTSDKFLISDTMQFSSIVQGNYKIEQDTIRIALDAHYFSKEHLKRGYIKDSILYLRYIKKDKTESEFEGYRFLKNGTRAIDY